MFVLGKYWGDGFRKTFDLVFEVGDLLVISPIHLKTSIASLFVLGNYFGHGVRETFDLFFGVGDIWETDFEKRLTYVSG